MAKIGCDVERGGGSMSQQFFAPKDSTGRPIRLPVAYRRTVKWLPKIGDIFPNFRLPSTQGDIDFWPWAEGNWVLLFGHPAANTAVCTTEIGALAQNEKAFRRLGAKVLGLTGSSVDEQLSWHADIEKLYGARVWFPTAADIGGDFASLFGMVHEKEHQSWPVRKSFLLDPQMKIRMIFEYPIYVGRSVEETLRVIEAVKLHSSTGLATPSDWFEGDPVIIPDTMEEAEVQRLVGNRWGYVLPYLRVAPRLENPRQQTRGCEL
ncbi:peroxiredoxin [Thioclava nitratireducens]|uniref:peroxiredoxin n=1 Tax=Thioclava nitratireducens TaxID=1915078 RepID=UPI00142F5AB9|nr:redoxin domain-containing protein [Thioclava nitratireducens]